MQPSHDKAFRPRMVLAYVDSAFSSLAARQFRRLGWEVYLASTAEDAHRLTAALAPLVVIIDTELPEESGWLVCAKLLMDQPKPKIILIGPMYSEESKQRATFLGASGFLGRTDGVTALIAEVRGQPLPKSA